MTKSQTIRNSFLTVNNILKCISSNYNARLLSMFLNIKVQDYLKDSDYLMTDLFSTLIKMQLLTDLYIHDIYSDKKDNNFLYIKRTMEEKDVNYVFNNLNVLIASCNSNILFREGSAYYKILLMKSLTEEDVNFLNEYNFMFEEEYNKYNIKIDGKFIIRQITKWKNVFDEDKAIKQTFLFIDKLYKINKEELDDLINDLIECLDINIDELLDEIENGNVKYICDLLRQYYELNNDIKKLKK